MSKEKFLEERTRAEDIILGALGYDCTAKILEIKLDGDKFIGKGIFEDGEEFDFESEDELSDLDHWAVSILNKE